MPIKVGDRLPNATFRVMTPDGPKPKTTDEVFKGKKVVLFAVPGAFTPTCSKNHLPGFVTNADSHQGQGHRRDRGDEHERSVRAGRLEKGSRSRQQDRFPRPTATPISPRRSALSSMPPAMGLGIRSKRYSWWSRTAW